MSFRAQFEVDGKTFEVMHCSYSLQRDTDFTGRPSSTLHGGTIQMEIESSDDVSLLEWMTDPYAMKSGKVTFFKRDSEAKMKELEFEDGYMITYSESISAFGNNPMVQNFTISSKKIKMGGASHTNKWTT